jgi:hypothetical protein
MADIAESLPGAGSPRIAKPAARAKGAAVSRIAAWLRWLGTRSFFLAVAAILYAGWSERGEQHLTAESGLGYALGICGAAMMLLLLLYPLRKRLKFMGRCGRVRYWFRSHMLLGIAGPVLILFHANFKIGSLNSSIALASMLLVAASGLVGRYIYSKIHYGLYGRRASLRELHRDVAENRAAPGLDFDEAGRIRERLQAFEADLTTPRLGVLQSIGLLLTVGIKTHWMQIRLSRELKRALRVEASRRGWGRRTRRSRARAARLYISTYLSTVRKVAGFTFYERLFALWHVLHLPLFFFLVLAAIVHVVAVHLY